MIPNMNLSEARTNRVPPDGYVMKVIRASIDEKYNRLQLDLDITEGNWKGHFTELSDRFNFWGMTYNLYFDRASAWKFAKAIDAFRASNTDFHWEDDGENDEQKLVGKYVGIITREKEYIGNDGLKKTRLVAHSAIPVEDVRSGNFEIPEKITLDRSQNAPEPAGVVDTTMGTTMSQEFIASADDTPF